jgi:hypothetical protein
LGELAATANAYERPSQLRRAELERSFGDNLPLAVSTDSERPRLEAEFLELNRQLKGGHRASF